MAILLVLLLWFRGADEKARRTGTRASAERVRGSPSRESAPKREIERADDSRSRTRSDAATKARTLTIRAVTTSGQPAPGISIVVRDHRREFRVAGVTDADGTYVLIDPPRVTLDVYYVAESELDPIASGRWYPTAPEEVTFTVPEPRDFQLHVAVEGRPELPEGLKITGIPFRELRRDEERGIIHARCYEPPTKRLRLHVSAPDLYAVTEPRASPDGVRLHVALRRGQFVTLDVKGDDAHRREIEVVPTAYGQGLAMHVLREGERSETLLRYLITTGRYRVRFRTSKLVLDEFDVRIGDEPRTLTIDLRDARECELVVRVGRRRLNVAEVVGRVPSGDSIVRFRGSLDDEIIVREPGTTREIRVPTGTRLLHPGDRMLEASVAPGRYAPAPNGGARPFDGRQDQLVLQAVSAAHIQFTWVDLPAPSEAPSTVQDGGLTLVRLGIAGLTIHLRDTSTKRTYRYRARPSGSIRSPIPHEGRFDVMIQSVSGGCLILRNRELRNDVDLGSLNPARRVDLELQLPEPLQVWPLSVEIVEVGSQFVVTRATIPMGARTRTIAALPPGKLRIEYEQNGKRWSETIVRTSSGTFQHTARSPR